jgi:ABC-type polysaccharide/polyol phosphate transport system ATPase subunit
MSSELLLRATRVQKTYAGSTHPMATLMHALFGRRMEKRESFKVLHHISLDIHRGETVGIMGQNGAGKTTLLGILGNVIEATGGTVERFGRIATLLGLTAGFNPNFTGRDNAYLFCSIQGLSRKQTDARIDDIRKFADLGRYFDLPLRTYSSGMQARLAFACAVHVSADLIIIDETLAVGDANFRMKCYDRIRRMKADGQTFLLVSHSPNLVANFCTRGIVLDQGHVAFDGNTPEAIDCYKKLRLEATKAEHMQVRHLEDDPEESSDEETQLSDFSLSEEASPHGPVGVITATLTARRDMENVTLNFSVLNGQGIVVCAYDGVKADQFIPELKQDTPYPVRMLFAKTMLPGRYFFTCYVRELVGDEARAHSIHQNFLSVEIPGESSLSGLANLDLRLEFPGKAA